MAKGKYEKWLTDEGLTLIEDWARNGLTDKQIAHNMGIRRETLYEWEKKYPNISNTLKKGKEIVDAQAENALLKRVLGYDVTETKVVESPNGITKTTTTKHIPPDVTACIIWLKNRRRGKWGDKQVEKTDSDESQGITFEIVAASTVRGDEDDNETDID